MIYTKLASAIYNDIVGGLSGFHLTPKLSMEQLEDEVAMERMRVIKQYALQGVIPKKDLMVTISCIPVDCKSIERCRCGRLLNCEEEKLSHFEIPQVAFDYGDDAIEYIGTTDRLSSFKVYQSPVNAKYNKYRKRNTTKPYVFIDHTPNENNMYDGFIFNAPMIKTITAVLIPKDLRQLENYSCCDDIEIDTMSFINLEVRRNIVTEKILLYSKLMQLPNTQQPLSI